MLSGDQIIERIEAAFMPYECGAVIDDYGAKIKFQIRENPDSVILTFEELNVRDLNTEENLSRFIARVKDEVAARIDE